MSKNLDYYMSLGYRIEVIPDESEGGFTLHCPELYGCITCAETIEQGFVMLEDAKRSWFASCIEDNMPIPEPDNMSYYAKIYSSQTLGAAN